jgi:HK97 gp10 family phage protein
MKEVIGEQELAQKFDDLSAILGGDTLQDMLMATGLVFERAAKEKIKEKGLIDTGRLRASVVTQALSHKTVVVGVQNLVYAAIHEFGGVIKPKNGSYLRFKTKDGNWVTTKEVTMPARPYMRPAFYENVDEGVAEFGRLFTAHMEKVART